MAHLGEFFINTEGRYEKVADLTGITFEDGKQYTFQIQNSATVISAAEKPTKGGFYINTPALNLYTKQAGEDLWIKTESYFYILNPTILNISE